MSCCRAREPRRGCEHVVGEGLFQGRGHRRLESRPLPWRGHQHVHFVVRHELDHVEPVRGAGVCVSGQTVTSEQLRGPDIAVARRRGERDDEVAGEEVVAALRSRRRTGR